MPVMRPCEIQAVLYLYGKQRDLLIFWRVGSGNSLCPLCHQCLGGPRCWWRSVNSVIVCVTAINQGLWYAYKHKDLIKNHMSVCGPDGRHDRALSRSMQHAYSLRTITETDVCSGNDWVVLTRRWWHVKAECDQAVTVAWQHVQGRGFKSQRAKNLISTYLYFKMYRC